MRTERERGTLHTSSVVSDRQKNIGACGGISKRGMGATRQLCSEACVGRGILRKWRGCWDRRGLVQQLYGGQLQTDARTRYTAAVVGLPAGPADVVAAPDMRGCRAVRVNHDVER